MDNLIQVASVPIIVAIVYNFMNVYKQVVKGKKEIYMEIIPIISAILGTILGIVAYYLAPGIIVADNLLVAILVGLTSGLASTGTHQIFKQISKHEESKTDGGK